MADQKESESKEEGPRSFASFFANLADGEAESLASGELFELCRELGAQAALRSTLVKGTLAVKITVAVDQSGTAAIVYTVEKKTPKPATSRGLYWLTKGGNLTPENPKQQKLALRDVKSPKREVRDPSAAAPAEEVF